MSLEYVRVNWAKDGPTQGTATLVGELNKKGRGVIDAGQGAELPLPDGELSTLLSAGTHARFTGLYNTSPGGDHNTRHKVAGHVERIYRMPSHAENTYLYQGQGRVGVKLAFEVACQPHMDKPQRPIVIQPSLRWDTLTHIATRQGMQVGEYNVHHTNPALAIETAIGRYGEANVGAILLNYPLNPTSATIEAAQMQEIFSVLDRVNAKPGVEIHAILDMPYAFAAATGNDGRGRFIRSGVENVLQGVEATKWTAVLSGSKLLGAANNGLSILVASPLHNGEFGKALSISGIGLARNEQLLHNTADVLAAREDLIWRRIDDVRGKYTANRAALEQAFGDWVMPGSANMLSVLRFPAGSLLDHEVACCDGEKRVLGTGYDVVEYLANEHGIGVVYNGIDNDGNFLLRLAQRETPEVFAEGVRRLKHGIDAVLHAPSVAPPAAGGPAPGFLHRPPGAPDAAARLAPLIAFPRAAGGSLSQQQQQQVAAAQASTVPWPGGPSSQAPAGPK